MANIEQRPAPPVPVMTPELWAKKKLTFRERVIENPPPYLLTVGILLALPVTAGAYVAGSLILGTLCLIFGIIIGGIAIGWWDGMRSKYSSALPRDTRSEWVYGRRALETRAHRLDELGRLPELWWDYERYSCRVRREKRSIKVEILKHEPRRSRFPYQMLPWRTKTSKEGFNSSTGMFQDDPIQNSVVDNPTLAKVQEVLKAAMETAARLENKSYAEVLEKHKLDAMALSVSPPPASKRVREHVQRQTEDTGPPERIPGWAQDTL